MNTLYFDLLARLYTNYLRELIQEKINDPHSEWDDFLLAVMDRVFGYAE